MSHGEAGQTLELILSPTPFYGESGGQIGDEGALFNADGVLLGKVTTTQKPVDGLHVSTVELKESLKAGDEVYADTFLVCEEKFVRITLRRTFCMMR